MRMRTSHRLTTAAATAVLTLGAVAGSAAPAAAVPADRDQVLAGWTQTSAASQDAWLAARGDQAAWAAYEFDWSTDYCTAAPDNPFGYPFELSCARHDFGYRNYKELGTFEENKARLDSAFHEDLKRVCDAYDGAAESSCDSLAWTYYQAVSIFG
jgi:hypothetical protein